jgi:hypothetical protein
MRTLRITTSDLASLARKLVDARFSGNQADSALQLLQAINPHVDLNKLAVGTVLLVPDAPAFKASASTPLASDALGSVQELVRTGLAAAAARLTAANAALAANRAAVAAVQKTRGFKRAIDADPQLKEQLDGAAKAFKDDEHQAAEAEQALDTMSKRALAELAALGKLLG